MSNPCVILSVLLLLQVWPQLAVSRSDSVVKFLPGFEGPLPFELETGYIGVGKSEEVQLFYYFVKSYGNAKEDPLLLWLSGGPGCSGFSSLAIELGPLHFEEQEYNGSIPTLVLNPNSWTKEASIIFIDSPVGTGFSYATTHASPLLGDFIQIRQLHQFLKQWLMEHPEFVSNPTYISGDSYSGIIIPPLVQQIINGNEEGIEPLINLKGYLLGNPVTDITGGANSQIPFANGMGLISYELYESLKSSCGGEYVSIDPENAECLKHMQAFNECTSHLNLEHILEPDCRKSLEKWTFEDLLDFEPSNSCLKYEYVLSVYWANENAARKALHVREGTIGKWKRCNSDLPYTQDIYNSVKYHAYIGKKGYRSLIYSGDHDMVVPSLSTQEWIRSLDYSIISDWHPWHVQGQVAGYTRTYSNNMTFATVKGAGHVAPEYRPEECFAMFKRWIHQQPL